LTLRSTISTPEGKRRYVRRLFATIADRYDLITVLLSYGRDRHWKRRLIELAAVGPRDRLLDLACGTGDLLFAAAARQIEHPVARTHGGELDQPPLPVPVAAVGKQDGNEVVAVCNGGKEPPHVAALALSGGDGRAERQYTRIVPCIISR